jgi:hypothetical protein
MAQRLHCAPGSRSRFGAQMGERAVSNKSKVVRGLKCALFGAFASLAVAAVLPGCAAEMAPSDESEQMATQEPVGEAQQAVVPGDVAGWALYGGYFLHEDKTFNSTGGAITVTEFGENGYSLAFEGLGSGGGDQYGNVQVTAVGKADDRCKVSQWYSVASTLIVNVRCHFSGGSPSRDSAFLVSYARFAGGTALSQDGAYLLSNSLTGATAAPSWYQWGAVGSVEHTSTGVYNARFAGQTNQDAGVIVTALGKDPSYCKVGNWYPSGSDTVVVVRCFDDTGAPVDSRFSLRLAREMRDSDYGSGGYVWAHNPTAIDYTPTTAYHQNHGESECGVFSSDNTIHKFYTGMYTVTYPRLSGYGAAFATAYGSSSDYCKTEWWQDSPGGAGFDQTVRCFSSAGFLKNSTYTSVLFSQWYGIC